MYQALCIKELHSCVKRVYGCSGAGTGGQGATASLPFYREGQGAVLPNAFQYDSNEANAC